MIIAIIGPRNLVNEEIIESKLQKSLEQTGKPKYIHCGDSKFDKALQKICKKLKIKTKEFKALWNDIDGKPDQYIKTSQYGQYYSLAGIERDKELISSCDALICLDLESSMIGYAKKNNITVYIEQHEESEGMNFWDE